MSWEMVHCKDRCHRCSREMLVGHRWRRSDSQPVIGWCEPCAAFERLDSPPDVLEAPTVRSLVMPKPKARGLELIAGRDITARILGERE